MATDQNAERVAPENEGARNWLVRAHFDVEADSMEAAAEKLRQIIQDHPGLLDIYVMGEFNPNFEKNYGPPEAQHNDGDD